MAYPNLNRHARPVVNIPQRPPGAAEPINPSPSAAYSFQLTPPPYPDALSNPWDAQAGYSPETPRQRTQSISVYPTRHESTMVEPTMSFPSPQIFRSTSARPSPPPSSLQTPTNNIRHRHSRSELLGGVPAQSHQIHRMESVASFASSYNAYDDTDQYSISSDSQDSHELVQQVAGLSLLSNGLQHFQAGTLPEADQEWHKLVPEEAREALGEDEVQRQSVIFELFKAEKEYVMDLEAVKELYIDRLRLANPPVIEPKRIEGFISEVFGNLDQILSNHQRMLGALFSRQREQHPLIQSIADIVLDTTLREDFRGGYEVYIKHYPLSESYHRMELKRNTAYQGFLTAVAKDPRIRKRDLITFLSRPVTRLPRLNLVLEQILKLTPKGHDHPDLDTLPIIVGILSDFVKSTQPGIVAAENKVKYWALCESLVFQKGEMIDLDLYDDSRSLVYLAPLYRRTRMDSGWSGWVEHSAALLDHYFIITREEKKPNGVIKRYMTSRPLPLSYLRLGTFDGPAEVRKERAEDGVLAGLFHTSVPIYPFTVYHSLDLNRRYTLCAPTEEARKKWKSVFVEAAAIHKARQEGNMFFDPQTLTDRFFRYQGSKTVYSAAKPLTGRAASAVTFTARGQKYVVLGCVSGIFLSPFGQDKFRKVLNYQNLTSMAAITAVGNRIFDKLIVHAGTSLVSYSLDVLARVGTGQAQARMLDASMEKVVAHDSNILLFRYAQIGQRALVIYASKKMLQSSLNLHVLEVLDVHEAKRATGPTRSFRRFGDTGYVPKDAYDIVTTLVKTIGVCTNDGIVIMDPTNIAKSAVTVVPDFHNSSTNAPLASLKSRIDSMGAKPLGLIRCDASEILVVFNAMGCYITKHGVPARSAAYIKWETEAVSYAHRGPNFLLFSPQSIEIRKLATGILIQTIDALDIRLLYAPPSASDDTILVAMRGEKDDEDGTSDKIVQLIETSEISIPTSSTSPTAVPSIWDEWDM